MSASIFLHAAARRLAALALLVALAAALLPLLAAPVERWFADAEALAASREIAARVGRLEGKAAAVASLAARPNPPFLVAENAEGAFAMLRTRIEAAAPVGAMRIEALQNLPREDKPSAPVTASFGFVATQGALQAFLAEIETRPPFLAVDEMELAAAREADGQILLSGTATLSALPLLRRKP